MKSVGEPVFEIGAFAYRMKAVEALCFVDRTSETNNGFSSSSQFQ